MLRLEPSEINYRVSIRFPLDLSFWVDVDAILRNDCRSSVHLPVLYDIWYVSKLLRCTSVA